MKAALIDRYGGNDAVSVADTDVPTFGATDLLVRVHAASVNPVDIKTREGKLKTLLKYRLPLVLGNDLSGVVIDAGSRVTRFKKGDAVYARVVKDRIGTFAEFATVRDGATALKPTNVTFEEAASLPLVALTAWQALVEIGRLGADQRVLMCTTSRRTDRATPERLAAVARGGRRGIRRRARPLRRRCLTRGCSQRVRDPMEPLRRRRASCWGIHAGRPHIGRRLPLSLGVRRPYK